MATSTIMFLVFVVGAIFVVRATLRNKGAGPSVPGGGGGSSEPEPRQPGVFPPKTPDAE